MRHVTRMPMRSNDFESELSFSNTEIAFGNKVVEIGKKTRLCCSPMAEQKGALETNETKY
jgi:hypothetical protein